MIDAVAVTAAGEALYPGLFTKTYEEYGAPSQDVFRKRQDIVRDHVRPILAAAEPYIRYTMRKEIIADLLAEKLEPINDYAKAFNAGIVWVATKLKEGKVS